MIKLYKQGAYLLNGTELVEDTNEVQAIIAAKTGKTVNKEEAAKETLDTWKDLLDTLDDE